MLRAVSKFYLECPALEIISAVARRDVHKSFRAGIHSSTASDAASTQQSRRPKRYKTTVLRAETPPARDTPPPSSPPAPAPRHSSGDAGGSRRAVNAAAAAIALTATLGGVYYYRKLSENENLKKAIKTNETGSEDVYQVLATQIIPPEAQAASLPPPYPSSAAAFPKHVQYLIAGGGTAGFAALRAIRSSHPTAQVLVVSSEHALPYMRPPLSKELWREPDLQVTALNPDKLTFRQWNGKRRSVTYEPEAFYCPVDQLEGAELGGVGVARGWTVTKVDVETRSAELVAPGQEPFTVTYDKCLLATGARPKRLPALSSAAAAGRSLCLRSVADVARVAAVLSAESTRRVAVVGGGYLATELAAALADRLSGTGKQVLCLMKSAVPLEDVLPKYLCERAAATLTNAGATLLPETEVVAAKVIGERVNLQLSTGENLDVDLVLECVGSEPETALAEASELEISPEFGGVVVNAELLARSDVYVAGDLACFHDPYLGRRRVEHHDHAVVSGRLAGDNMAATRQGTVAKPYRHQALLWSDLGPDLGYEAIGIIDSSLPTVGVFCDKSQEKTAETVEAVGAEASPVSPLPPTPTERVDREKNETDKQFGRGVVFYLREKRVVGVLLWNLFNKMHLARQVVSQGEFDDLLEVGKLFAPHEEE